MRWAVRTPGRRRPLPPLCRGSIHGRTIVADSGVTVNEDPGLWREYNNTASATYHYPVCSSPPAATSAPVIRRPVFPERR